MMPNKVHSFQTFPDLDISQYVPHQLSAPVWSGLGQSVRAVDTHVGLKILCK